MKKAMKKVFALILAVLMFLTVVSCTGKEEKAIKSLLLEFEYACNSLDAEALLDCLEPAFSDRIRFATSLFGVDDIDEMFDTFVAFLLGSSDGFVHEIGTSGVDFLESIDIEIQEIVIQEDNEESGVVEAVITADILGRRYVRKAEFLVVYYIDHWCISEFYIL